MYMNFLNLCKIFFAKNDIKRYIIILFKKFNYEINRLI